MDTNNDHNQIVIVGGGIAATTCLKTLFQLLDGQQQQQQQQHSLLKHILIICPTQQIKVTDNLKITGRRLETFDVLEQNIYDIIATAPTNLTVNFINAIVVKVEAKKHLLTYLDNNTKIETTIQFQKLCLCTGAKPKNVEFLHSCLDVSQNARDKILVLRDTDTVSTLKQKLIGAKRITIVGNGGISLETVFKIRNCHKTWIIKDGAIGSTFFDSGAAKFLIDSYHNKTNNNLNTTDNVKQNSIDIQTHKASEYGCSLGPNWNLGLNLEGNSTSDNTNKDLTILYKDEVVSIHSSANSQSLVIKTLKGSIVESDLIILALGVIANSDMVNKDEIELSKCDNAILVDKQMRSFGNSNIYAAGDVASCDNWNCEDLWFQMKLWTQARQMGFYVARCMVDHIHGNTDTLMDFSFECFTHVTKFFDRNVTLIGLYNGQKLNDAELKDFEVLVRANYPSDYIKLLINKLGCIVGAVMIGDSGLEETIENLINDRIDVRPYKESLLDNTTDIEDYFD